MSKDKKSEDEVDIYTDWEQLLTEDEISDIEAGFMFGYDEDAIEEVVLG